MKNPLTLVIGSVLILIFVMLLFVFQVRTNEVAVVTTFNKPTRDRVEPGAYFKWLWPIQKVHKFDKRIHNFESKFEQVLTADGHNLIIWIYIGWNINEPKVFLPRFGGSTQKAEEILEGLVRNAYSGVVGKHPFAHFISTDEKELKFAEIEQEILQRVQTDARANNYGVDVKFLGIKKLGLPESVTKVVFERMQSERQLRVTEIQSAGESQAEQIRTAANLESSKMLADAEAEARRIQGMGEAEAFKYYEVFKQDPALANFLFSLSGLESFLKERTTLILDQSTPPLQLLKEASSASMPKPALAAPVGAAPEATTPPAGQQARKTP